MEEVYIRYRKLKKDIRDLAATDIQKLYRGFKSRYITGRYRCSYKTITVVDTTSLSSSASSSSLSSLGKNNRNPNSNNNGNNNGNGNNGRGMYSNGIGIGDSNSSYKANNISSNNNSTLLRKFEVSSGSVDSNVDGDSYDSDSSNKSSNYSVSSVATTTAAPNTIATNNTANTKIPNSLYLSYKKLLTQKRDLKRKLKKFDEDFFERYHRVPKKNDKEIIRPMYQTYHEVVAAGDDLAVCPSMRDVDDAL